MLLLSFLSVYDPQFSLTPPHIETNANEIGNWTLRGSATILKQSIRLTNAIPNSAGALCQRIPSLFRDWIFEMHISAFGGNGGREFWFYFTNELCPIKTFEFSGFCVWINTSISDENGLSPFFFVQTNGSLFSPSDVPIAGKVRVRSDLAPLRLRLTRRNDRIIIEGTNQFTPFKQLFETTTLQLPEYGYFTVSAVTTTLTDNNDLHSIETTPLSPHSHEISADLEDLNRRAIENSVYSRRLKKVNRRLAMEQILKYFNRTDQPYNLTDAFLMVEEMRVRALDTITLSDLLNFIETAVGRKVAAAYAKISKAESNFQEIREDLRTLWVGLQTELVNLSLEIRIQMNVLEVEARDAALRIPMNNTNTKELYRRWRENAREGKRSQIRDLLFYLALVEIGGFFIFFWYIRRKFARKME